MKAIKIAASYKGDLGPMWEAFRKELGKDPSEASEKERKSVFRKLSKKFHPDKGGSSESFTSLKEVFENFKKGVFDKSAKGFDSWDSYEGGGTSNWGYEEPFKKKSKTWDSYEDPFKDKKSWYTDPFTDDFWKDFDKKQKSYREKVKESTKEFYKKMEEEEKERYIKREAEDLNSANVGLGLINATSLASNALLASGVAHSHNVQGAYVNEYAGKGGLIGQGLGSVATGLYSLHANKKIVSPNKNKQNLSNFLGGGVIGSLGGMLGGAVYGSYKHNKDRKRKKLKYKQDKYSIRKTASKKEPLNKPIRTPGERKKFKVYVKNDKGNVVTVRFGDPNMTIKKEDDARRKSFRARHKCDQKKDKTTAGYWSCKMWEK